MKQGIILWFTGLSGAGKTTIAVGLKERLGNQGIDLRIVDGDDIREKRDKPLSFSYDDIVINNRAVARLCADLRKEHDLILVPIISPIKLIRAEHRRLLSPNFYEVYIKADLNCVKKRDVKGLYQKALQGQIKDMIGCEGGVAYESADDADIVIDTEKLNINESINTLEEFIKRVHKVQR